MTGYVIGPDVAIRLARELTQLHADAFITLDEQLAAAARLLVTIAPIEALS